ncbi:MAG: hypothetical protein LBS59_03660 [Puniceicoccales bacterium]|jgi:hypothetical protein|nr:hypothetical protein [Puniceicoccales bacterium]
MNQTEPNKAMEPIPVKCHGSAFRLSLCKVSIPQKDELDAEIKLYLTPDMFITDNLSMINSSISRLPFLAKTGTASSTQ